MTTATLAEFAAILGVSRPYVTKLKKQGRLVLNESGKVEVEASRQRIAESEGGRADVKERNAAQRAAQKADAENISLGMEAGGRAKWKAMSLHYENQSLKLEMALRRGLRFELEAVKREAHGLGNTVRAALERLIDQTAPRMAIMHSNEERLRLLESETKALRRVIKSEFPRALRRMKRAEKNG